jgi:hypothetical protein
MGSTCSKHDGDEKLIRNYYWKMLSKIPLLGPRRSWEDNIKMDHKVMCVRM